MMSSEATPVAEIPVGPVPKPETTVIQTDTKTATISGIHDFLTRFSSPTRAHVFYCNIQNVIMDAQYILLDGDSLLV